MSGAIRNQGQRNVGPSRSKVTRSEGRKVGRPSTGITKKVSLTLTEEEWKELENFDTVSLFIKEHIKGK